MELNKIICGDCLEVLKTFPENCIDTIITDPPYGLEFMGKEWDSFKETRKTKSQVHSLGAGMKRATKEEMINFQEWFQLVAKEMLRVAKPGSTLLCFGGTRTFHRLACAIEDAGWVIKDTLCWLYGSGFPKATDISKQLDKRAGVEREVVGKKITPSGQKYPEGYDKNSEIFERANANITIPATPEAKQWNGWKSHGLKPAYEPIIMAMKPNEGSYAENALKYGVSGLNIDGGRIGMKKDDAEKSKKKNESFRNAKREYIFSKEGKLMGEFNPQGRFPANLILDEESAEMLDEMSGERPSPGYYRNPNRFIEQNEKNYITKYNPGNIKDIKGLAKYSGETGGASRFFYVAKASRAERNMGCEGLEEKASDLNSGGIGRKCSVEKRLEKHGVNTPTMNNNHPTVKPLKLMEYLCLLTKTPTGGIILDPFAGSGTTCMAAKKTGRDFIGIEKEPEYCKIAEARINAVSRPLL